MSELNEQLPALLPCPFCGAAVDLERAADTREPMYGVRQWWGVVCRSTRNLGGSCAIEQRPSASPAAAIERWNRRAPAVTQAAPSEPVLWQPIATLPESDDLVWLRHGDSIEGPRVMDPYDYDRFSEWAPCEPPGVDLRATPAPAQQAESDARDAVALLNAEQIAALRRFNETCEDGEGYDVRKHIMKELACIGVIRRTSGAWYEITDFGNYVLDRAAIASATTSTEGRGHAE